ncbi:zf-HC2 domain-containing protein [Streptomyces sp. NBC_01218]|uniref:zf-HC2 domain-containing protein n=1 Tax=unclassified Streptomyces TaxID=2593676 RepID=UPI0023B8BD88|nr:MULTISPECIES: zf-HC2 domain-containing protein [unclassified Streptomyces]WEH38384.1 zf-HC2 domain-containing protein [Streptomyces sp. AM 2-1-1]WSQ50042.1 zf-HC2 domain-containing protein [Streptomyces sp. NBC_01218]
MTTGPSEHPHVELLLGAYVLDALTGPEAREVSAHLLGCDGCAAAYTEVVQASGLLVWLTERDLLGE